MVSRAGDAEKTATQNKKQAKRVENIQKPVKSKQGAWPKLPTHGLS